MSYYGSGGGGGGYDRGRDMNQSGGGGFNRERSRSRDHFDGRGGGRGRDFQGRGGGRGDFRGGRGRGGGRGGPRPTSIEVSTNYFKLEQTNNVQSNEYIQYKVRIADAVRRRNPETGESTICLKMKRPPRNPQLSIYGDGGKKEGDKPEEEEEVKEEPMKEMDLSSNTPKSRRILNKLRKNLSFATDGGDTIYSSDHLFDPANDTTTKVYEVVVKADCEEDDPNADRTKNKWFLVTLERVATIPTNIVNLEKNELEHLRQASDIVQKTALVSAGMKSFGKNPRKFYFRNEHQYEIFNHLNQKPGRKPRICSMFFTEPTFQPVIGLTQSIKFCANNTMFVNTDTVVDFCNREFGPRENPIPIVNEEVSTIAGVRVDLRREVNPGDRKKIEDNLEALNINVFYQIPLTEEFESKMKEKGLSHEEILKRNKQVRRNKFLKTDMKKKAKIIWRADNAELYSFSARIQRDKDPIEHTVYSYYKDRYGINLKFPHLPIVFLGNREWFPIEFLYQGHSKLKNANSPKHVEAVLGYYDANAGTDCIENIKNLSRMVCAEGDFKGVLSNFNLKREEEPQKLMAKVLPEPNLSFAGSHAGIRNGSWNLRDVKFESPAEIQSFAVLDLTARGDNRGQTVVEFVRGLFQASLKHNMKVPHSSLLEKLIIPVPQKEPYQVVEKLDEAINRAKQVFLFDSEDFYKSNKIWFKTTVKNDINGELSEALIIPPPPNMRNGDEVGLILPFHINEATHKVTNPNNNTQHDARICVAIMESDDPVDPFDFVLNDRGQQCVKSGDTLKPANFKGFLFRIIGGPLVKANDVGPNPSPALIVKTRTVDFPSIVIAFKNDEATDDYGMVKMASQYFHGCQTQCVSANKFTSQRNRDQYCSNIALKVNAKLSNSINRACAWKTSSPILQQPQQSEGIPWVSEVPTLVLGISISSGYGRDTFSVIAMSACLDKGCMQFAQDVQIQTKTELIDRTILTELTKRLLTQYYLYNYSTKPQRILVYRDGVSDGSFEKLEKREVEAIRNAYLEWSREVSPDGEHFCPPITFVVCNTNHTVRIVPASVDRDARDKNVPSGTCVDHTIIDVSAKLHGMSLKNENLPTDMRHFNQGNDVGEVCDFILTSQGGLKGTSKPIYYRVITNENVEIGVNGASPLSKEKLECATYQMSFQYSTATKAVRAVPVLFYSTRLARVVVGYVGNLIGTKGNMGENHIVTVKLDDVEGEEIPLQRDGTPVDRFKYVHNNLEQDDGVPSWIKNAMFRKFNPSFHKNRPGLPFHTHISC